MTCLIEIHSHSKPGTQNSTVGVCLSGQVGANSLRSCKYVSTNPNSKKWPLLSLLTTGSALDLVSPARRQCTCVDGLGGAESQDCWQSCST